MSELDEKKILLVSLIVVFLMLMIPVMPAVEYNPIEEIFDIESKETAHFKINRISSIITARREYTAPLENYLFYYVQVYELPF